MVYTDIVLKRLYNYMPLALASLLGEDVIVNFDWFTKEKFQLIKRTVIEIFPADEKKSKDRRLHLSSFALKESHSLSLFFFLLLLPAESTSC